MSLSAAAIAIGLLAANAFFVAAEFALLASRRSRIEQLAADGARGAGQALAGLRELSLMLAGAQLGITMASLGLGAVAEPAVAHGLEQLIEPLHLPVGVTHSIAFVIALSIVVFLHMVVGEMAPKSWAITHPESSALLLAPPFRAFALIFRPFIGLLNAMANGVVRLWGLTPQDELAGAHSPGDLLLLARESAEHGTLAGDQHGLLERAIDLSGLDAEAAMVARRDIIAVPSVASVAEIEQVTSRTGRSRLPVYEGELDRITGVVHVKDVLAITADDRDRVTAADLARSAFITVESRPIEGLMLEMRQERAHMAIVVDEYGSVSGLVALEDLIEELIGDFDDETDAGVRLRSGARAPLRRRRDGAVAFPGSLRPDELADRVGVRLPEGDYETVAGYVIAQLGRLPEEGEHVPGPDCSIEVTAMDGPRIVELSLRPGDASDARAE